MLAFYIGGWQGIYRMLAVLGLGACGLAAPLWGAPVPVPAAAAPSRIRVVAAEDFYANVAAQIGARTSRPLGS